MQNRIRELRKQRGMTMKELGKVIGVAESTVSQYELGRRQPDNETLLTLGEFFEVSVDYLLGGVSYPDPRLKELAEKSEFQKKLDNLSRDMSEDEKRQLLLAARLIVAQRSEK